MDNSAGRITLCAPQLLRLSSGCFNTNHTNSPGLGGKSINKAGLHPASLTPRLFPPQETRLNCIRIARKGKQDPCSSSLSCRGCRPGVLPRGRVLDGLVQLSPTPLGGCAVVARRLVYFVFSLG